MVPTYTHVFSKTCKLMTSHRSPVKSGSMCTVCTCDVHVDYYPQLVQHVVFTVERRGGHSKGQAQLPSGRAEPNGVCNSSTEGYATPNRGFTRFH